MPSEESTLNSPSSARGSLAVRVRRARVELERTEIEAQNAKVEFKKWKKLHKRAKKAVKAARLTLEELTSQAPPASVAKKNSATKRSVRAKQPARK